ncbi:MAG TPA: DUF3570 domain-containing protein [Ramlibacter sp.]|nr:DUF3570 domain-containing protein [Ramlibacter sp.]
MAATERAGQVLAATLLLPGLAAVSVVRAEEPPAEGVIAFKYGWYRDEQTGFQRVTVQSPQVYILAPVAGKWSFEGTRVVDSVSGATPRLHTFTSSATPYMTDHRDATDVKVTRYFHRAAIAVGAAYSDENDYLSRTLGMEARFSSEDNNQTWNFGFARSQDKIDTSATGGFAFGERRRTTEAIAGLTQVLTPNDVVQLQLTRSIGSGYYSDPYKDFDRRPRRRNATIAHLRWNHHFDGPDASLRTSWRYYADSFGIRSHTLSGEWVRTMGAWTIAPGIRYYRQSAASFYFDPVPNAAGVPDIVLTALSTIPLTGFRSGDARLAAFGAVTISLKVGYAISAVTAVDVKLEAYRQSQSLRMGGGSPYLDPTRARFVQLGWSHKF